jgi:uncharacterized protein (UPF0333 family)
MKRGKSQVSMEFFLVVMIAFMIIVPLIIYFVNESQNAANEVNDAQVVQIARKIVSNAETVYAFGAPTTLTLRVYMPKGVESVYFSENQLNFVVGSGEKQSTISEPASMNITGNISNHIGMHVIRLTAANNSVSVSES